MPNWCSNEIKIHGTKEDVDAFEQHLSKSKIPFDFNLFLPYPEEFKVLDDAYAEAEAAGIPWDKLPKSGYEQGGYDWCVNQWGTKWNLQDASVNRDCDQDLSGNFDTAWSPPIGVLQAMSEKFPALTFTLTYWEGEMCFAGISTFSNGIEVDAKQWDGSTENEDEDEDEDEEEDEEEGEE